VRQIQEIVRREVAAYAKPPVHGDSFLSISEDGQSFSVIDIYVEAGERCVDAGLVVRLFDQLVVIERDMNDKPLVDVLMQAGIPRSQIILAYAGESVPEAV